jgi:hypothetical protein
MPIIGTVVQTEVPRDTDDFRIFPVSQNWVEPFKFSMEFLTDIITSVNGKEQRRAVRNRPRFVAEYAGNVWKREKRNLEFLATGWQHQQVMFGLEHLSLRTTAAMAPEAPSVSFEPVDTVAPFWLGAGMPVILVNGDDKGIRESRTIAAVGTSSITFQETSDGTFPVDSRIMPGYLGFLNQEQQTTHMTTRAGTANFSVPFRPAAGPPLVPDLGEPYYIGNLELFPFKPNWASGVGEDFLWPHKVVDYNFGQWRNWTPVEFPSRLYRFDYARGDLRSAYEIMAFFQRHKGMRSEFFLPTWQDDIPYTTLAGGGLSILVDGQAFGHVYQDSTVFRRIMVRYTDGTVSYHQVEYVESLPDTDSSVVRVIEPLPVVELTPQTVTGISWLLVSRFAQDRLDMQFLTGGVSTFTLSMRTLENFEL